MKNLLIALLIAAVLSGNVPCTAEISGSTHAETMVVCDTILCDSGKYEIHAVADDGNVFSFFAYDAFTVGETVTLELNDNGTETRIDDIITDILTD